MYSVKKNYDSPKDEDMEGVLHLLEKNIDCTDILINHIDGLIENTYFPKPFHDILTAIRNTCAVHVMNITRLTK